MTKPYSIAGAVSADRIRAETLSAAAQDVSSSETPTSAGANGDLRVFAWPLGFVKSATFVAIEGEDQWQQSHELTRMRYALQPVGGR